MEEESRKSIAQITLYNQLIKEMDDLYRVYAKNCNLFSQTIFADHTRHTGFKHSTNTCASGFGRDA